MSAELEIIRKYYGANLCIGENLDKNPRVDRLIEMLKEYGDAKQPTAKDNTWHPFATELEWVNYNNSLYEVFAKKLATISELLPQPNVSDAVEFAEWIRENYYKGDSGKWCIYKNEPRCDSYEVNFITQELYQLFLKQKQDNK